MSYPVPQEVYEILRREPEITGAQLARRLNLAGRSARRYVRENKLQGVCPVAPPVSAIQRHKVVVEPELLKAAVYDIEVTDFSTDGYKGVLLMCCILPLRGDEVQTYQLKYDDDMSDARVWREIREALSEYAILIGHNTAAFDENWFNSRGMPRRYAPMHAHLRFDTYQVAKMLGIKTGKSLGNLMAYFGIKTAEKTRIYATDWSQVFSHDRAVFEEAMEEIQYHCEQDVRGNRELFNHIYAYAMGTGTGNPFKMSKFRQVDF